MSWLSFILKLILTIIHVFNIHWYFESTVQPIGITEDIRSESLNRDSIPNRSDMPMRDRTFRRPYVKHMTMHTISVDANWLLMVQLDWVSCIKSYLEDDPLSFSLEKEGSQLPLFQGSTKKQKYMKKNENKKLLHLCVTSNPWSDISNKRKDNNTKSATMLSLFRKQKIYIYISHVSYLIGLPIFF